MLPQYTQFHNYMMYKLPLIGARVHTSNTVYHILFLRPLVDGSRYAQNSFFKSCWAISFDRFEKNQHNVVLYAWVQTIRNCTVSSANPNNTEQEKSRNTEQIDSDDDLWYPLVNSITNYRTSAFCSWVNLLFLWSFSIAFCMFTRPGTYGIHVNPMWFQRWGATLLVGAASGECELEPALSWAVAPGGARGKKKALGKWIKRHTIRYTNYISLYLIIPILCVMFTIWMTWWHLYWENIKTRGCLNSFCRHGWFLLYLSPKKVVKIVGHTLSRWQNGSVTTSPGSCRKIRCCENCDVYRGWVGGRYKGDTKEIWYVNNNGKKGSRRLISTS